MTSRCTRRQAFSAFGTKPRRRHSWSARSIDGRIVTVTLWRHELLGRAGGIVCCRHAWGDWHRGASSREFFDDLKWAVENGDGLVRVVVVVKDRQALRPRTLECYAARNLVMRVTHVDVEAGAFKLEQVNPAELLKGAA
jgi:hypothetical protein